MYDRENARSRHGQAVPEEGKQPEEAVGKQGSAASEYSAKQSPKQEKKGRIFISIDQQLQYLEAQRARYLQKEHKGVPVDKIAGQSAPVKVFLGENFVKEKDKIVKNLKADYTKLARLTKKCFGSENLDENHIAEKPNEAFETQKKEAEQLLTDLRDVTYLENQHQQLVQSQSQIHRGLHDIWRLQIQR
jgi:hypothetical protein